MKRVFVGVTGASGSIYGLRLVESLLDAGCEVHLCASDWGQKVTLQETRRSWASWTQGLGAGPQGRLSLWDIDNLAAGPASGSFGIEATVLCPCSVSTLGHLASGAATNLIHRTSAVALKEGKPLVLVPRETPLSLIDLRNLTTLAEAGAAVVPAMPAFYHQPETIDDLIQHLVGKVLDRIGVPHELFTRWKGTGPG